MLVSAKLAPTFDYAALEEFWRAADELGFHAIWDYDHFYGLADSTTPTLEGWTTLAAMAAVTHQARVGCMVTRVTYRHPAMLAKMAITVDHICGGRLDFGIGAGWHEAEHHAYGIEFPNPGSRVAMLDEALTVIRRLWTEESVSFAGRFFTLDDARCEPKAVQRPHPPIVIGGGQQKMLRVTARHANEWNWTGSPEEWLGASSRLDEACDEIGRDPQEIRRSVQLFLHPGQPGKIDVQIDRLPEYEKLGCQHGTTIRRGCGRSLTGQATTACASPV